MRHPRRGARPAAKRRPPRKAQEPPLPTQGRIRSLQRQAARSPVLSPRSAAPRRKGGRRGRRRSRPSRHGGGSGACSGRPLALPYPRREAPLRGEKEAAAEGAGAAPPDTGADPEPAAAGCSLSRTLAAKRRSAAKRRPPRKAQEPPIPTRGRIRSLQRQAARSPISSPRSAASRRKGGRRGRRRSRPSRHRGGSGA